MKIRKILALALTFTIVTNLFSQEKNKTSFIETALKGFKFERLAQHLCLVELLIYLLIQKMKILGM